MTADGTPVTLAQMRGREVSHLIQELDGYLCELAGAQIRDGLHILGQVPEGEQMVGLLQALTRVPNLDVPSLRDAVAGLFGLDLDAICWPSAAGRSLPCRLELARLADRPLVTQRRRPGNASTSCAVICSDLLQQHDFRGGQRSTACHRGRRFPASRCRQRRGGDRRATVLTFVCERLVPALRQTTDEIDNLLAGLEGRYVPAGPSGAPTRGMAHVLPTGRNFYAVDPRALPSAAAWQVGQELAREVLDRYRAETGAYPETVGISVWGTSAMRTHGDDVAEVLALLGVRPVWQKENRRVVGVEVIPLAELGRPRIDVTVRISGFFRDAFPHLIKLLDDAVQAVARRDEPPERNFVRKHYLADLAANVAAGLPEPERQARYRIFGSKPGSYGAGLLPLIDERNWHDDADFAETYVNWGGYAYTADARGRGGARTPSAAGWPSVQVALHNQDNREHDIFDSDDYFQFHGGMIATIRALTGRQPRHYFGDTHDPARPAVRDLKQEVLRVFRTRVVNPKWLEGITRHGYKGGLEMAATVDYLFGYDATAGVVGGLDVRAGRPDATRSIRRCRSSSRAAIRGRCTPSPSGCWKPAQRGHCGRQPSAETLRRRCDDAAGPRRDGCCEVAAERTGGGDPWNYPFAALVGQEPLKTALLLNAIYPGIGGVLIRGEKGTAKSTAARALRRHPAAAAPSSRAVRSTATPTRRGRECPHCAHRRAPTPSTSPVPFVDCRSARPRTASSARSTSSGPCARAGASSSRACWPRPIAASSTSTR